MKKGKLTETEKACIEGMIASDVSIEGMATQLDRSVSIIEKEAEKIKAQSVRSQLYINKTASGSKGISVMTEAASVRGDIAKDTIAKPSKAQRSAWIHKIHD